MVTLVQLEVTCKIPYSHLFKIDIYFSGMIFFFFKKKKVNVLIIGAVPSKSST